VVVLYTFRSLNTSIFLSLQWTKVTHPILTVISDVLKDENLIFSVGVFGWCTSTYKQFASQPRLVLPRTSLEENELKVGKRPVQTSYDRTEVI
jgi:hypothetical protein